MEITHSLPILTLLSQVIETFLAAMWNYRMPRHDTAWGTIPAIDSSILTRVRARMCRAEAALKSLMARFHAGKLRPATPRGRLVNPRTRAAPTQKPLPRQFGWFCPLMPSEAAIRGNHLNLVLAEPEMQELLAASPRAIAILKPICRMLAIHPSILVPGAPKLGLPGNAPPAVYIPPIVPGELIPSQFRVLWRPQTHP